MKYLVKFNESTSSLSEIKKFSEENLAYLIDQGFLVKVGFHSSGNIMTMLLTKPTNNINYRLYWDDIKDDFIPFLQVLFKKYNFSNYLSFNYARSESNGVISFTGTIKIHIDDVINDNIPPKCSILGIGLNKNMLLRSYPLVDNDVFNESSELNFKSLYDTCLVELYDDGFKLSTVTQESYLGFKLEKYLTIGSLNYDRMKWIGKDMGTIICEFNKDNSQINSTSKTFVFDKLLPYQKELLNNIDDVCNKLLHTFNCKSGVYELKTSEARSNDSFLNNEIIIYYNLTIILNT